MITDIVDRIIELSSLYATDKEFLKKCEISNHSFLTELKKGRLKNPGGEVLAQIVRGTGCNGTWLLTGEGEMFAPEQPRINEAAKGETYMKYFMQAARLIDLVEQQSAGLEETELPSDLALQCSKLMTRLLELQNKAHRS